MKPAASYKACLFQFPKYQTDLHQISQTTGQLRYCVLFLFFVFCFSQNGWSQGCGLGLIFEFPGFCHQVCHKGNVISPALLIATQRFFCCSQRLIRKKNVASDCDAIAVCTSCSVSASGVLRWSFSKLKGSQRPFLKGRTFPPCTVSLHW